MRSLIVMALACLLWSMTGCGYVIGGTEDEFDRIQAQQERAQAQAFLVCERAGGVADTLIVTVEDSSGSTGKIPSGGGSRDRTLFTCEKNPFIYGGGDRQGDEEGVSARVQIRLRCAKRGGVAHIRVVEGSRTSITAYTCANSSFIFTAHDD